ncbi:hypothetical protein [Halogeometricum luteum]|uniref:UVR domain-containing protein n=1 Tax=Halogeometricum luteum TaxID=2950537 RepID=A0ABU2G413_9EURY|nr:hypothetical protein [Halogeometricum sp. S3BR5-2]MDS0294893.1 hypothetical protein [Halogeometricum sp. S3BR5-2]
MHLVGEEYWNIDAGGRTISINASKLAYEQMDIEKAKEVRDTLSDLIEELEARH